MYSLVLMTAMTTTPTTAEFNGFFRDMFSFRGGCSSSCAGCTGCTGCMGMSYACSGCAGCSGYTSCTGCSGSESGFRARLRRLFGGNSCCGGCYGGCGGGGCYSSALVGCYGGMPMAPMIYGPPPGNVAPVMPYAPPEAAPAPIPAVIPDRVGARPSPELLTANPRNRGTVVVRLPADARLYAGDHALNMSGSERKFVTPELPAGQDYTYRFRVEYQRDGETISVTKRVAIRPGSTAALEFTDFTAARPQPKTPAPDDKPVAVHTSTASARPVPSVQPDATPVAAPAAPAPVAPAVAAAAHAERATIVIHLPAGATLHVDDRRVSAGEAVKTFATPPLPAGREFSYFMKAELMREGRPESFTQKVSVRAGERITVDFNPTVTGR